jgi:hypothetical protein
MSEDMQAVLAAANARSESLASALRLVVSWCEDDRELYGSESRRLWLAANTAKQALVANGLD